MTPDLLAELRTLATDWAAADTHHTDDYLRGFATGMSEAGQVLLLRLGEDA